MIVGISGIDGSGKTSFAKMLASRLSKAGFDASYERPKYSGNEAIKRWCEEIHGDPFSYFPHIAPDAYLGVVCADWLQWWYEEARSKHLRGAILCVDRWRPDTLSLAGLFGGSRENVENLLRPLPAADLSIWLRVTPDEADQRLEMRNPPRHRLESKAILMSLDKLLEREFSSLSPRLLGTRGEDLASIVDDARAVVTRIAREAN